jgi:hypothetical protein
MNGFVAPMRPVEGRPRFSRIDRSMMAMDAWTATDPDAADERTLVLEHPVESSARRPALELRWRAIRERWAQATFYLFDPNAWR